MKLAEFSTHVFAAVQYQHPYKSKEPAGEIAHRCSLQDIQDEHCHMPYDGHGLGPQLPPLDVFLVAVIMIEIDNDSTHDAVHSFHQDISVMQSFVVTMRSTLATGP
jgi:hypothetical protein